MKIHEKKKKGRKKTGKVRTETGEGLKKARKWSAEL